MKKSPQLSFLQSNARIPKTHTDLMRSPRIFNAKIADIYGVVAELKIKIIFLLGDYRSRTFVDSKQRSVDYTIQIKRKYDLFYKRDLS